MVKLSGVAAAALSLSLLVGCGGDTADSDGATPTGAQTTPVDGAADPSGEGTDGQCGSGEIDGVLTRTFCGDGTASLSNGSTTLELGGAECSLEALGFAVNAGTIVLDPADATVSAATQYIGFAIPPVNGEWAGDSVPDGTYEGIITGNDRGTDLTASTAGATIVITDGGTAGTVSGTSFEGETLTGSFNCG